MQVVIGWTSMEKIKTHLVFPTALHIFNHKMEQEEQQIMIEYIKGTKNKETLSVSGLSKHTKNNLHKIPEFARLRNTINDATHEVVKKMEYKYDSLEMTGMWGNALPKGNAHAPHSHSNHLFSGVYYVQSDELSSPIQFFDPRPQSGVMRPNKSKDNTLNSDIIAIPCTTGVGIIFPSWLTHWVPPTGSERVSISWNFIIRGMYGEPNSLQDVSI